MYLQTILEESYSPFARSNMSLHSSELPVKVRDMSADEAEGTGLSAAIVRTVDIHVEEAIAPF